MTNEKQCLHPVGSRVTTSETRHVPVIAPDYPIPADTGTKGTTRDTRRVSVLVNTCGLCAVKVSEMLIYEPSETY